MTHFNFILAAYGTAFLCLVGLVCRTIFIYYQQAKQLQMMMNKNNES